MDNDILISVVVPVYNTDKYLERCVKSIMENTYKNIEVFLVENGSTDKSHEICEELVSMNSKLKLLTCRKGLSVARNCGIRAAKGKYITFVDSDDYVSHDLFENLLDSIEKCSADMSYGEFASGCEDDFDFSASNKAEYKVETAENYFVKLHCRSDMTFSSAWCKLYSLKLIKEYQLLFNEDIRYAEDKDFNTKYVMKCRNIASTDSTLYYYYRGNQESICNDSHNMKERLDIVTSIKTNFDLTSEGTIFYECLALDLMQNADYRLKRAKVMNNTAQIKILCKLQKDAVRASKKAKLLPKSIKYKFIFEHYMPHLFKATYNLISRLR